MIFSEEELRIEKHVVKIALYFHGFSYLQLLQLQSAIQNDSPKHTYFIVCPLNLTF